MIVYLAGFRTIEKHYKNPTDDIYLLSSFYEHRNGNFGAYVEQEKHILDSGAFSFFGGKKNVDWKNYVLKYCDFINKTNQKLFFELDIDKVTSLKHAEKLRDIIEQKTGKQPIPVWRPSRGVDYWYKMCENYPYVAISASGAYDSAWTRKKESIPVISKLLKIAKNNNTKVHGLGFTSLPLIIKLKFYSIDSTTWLCGKFGEMSYFNFNEIKRIRKKNKKLINPAHLYHIHNFKEWVKFQKYADKNL